MSATQLALLDAEPRAERPRAVRASRKLTPEQKRLAGELRDAFPGATPQQVEAALNAATGFAAVMVEQCARRPSRYWGPRR